MAMATPIPSTLMMINNLFFIMLRPVIRKKFLIMQGPRQTLYHPKSGSFHLFWSFRFRRTAGNGQRRSIMVACHRNGLHYIDSSTTRKGIVQLGAHHPDICGLRWRFKNNFIKQNIRFSWKRKFLFADHHLSQLLIFI